MKTLRRHPNNKRVPFLFERRFSARRERVRELLFTRTRTHKMAEHQSLLRPRDEENDDASSQNRFASSFTSSKTWTKVLAGSGALVLAATFALSGIKSNSSSSFDIERWNSIASSRGRSCVGTTERVHQTPHGGTTGGFGRGSGRGGGGWVTH